MRWYYGWFEVAQSLSGGLAIPRAKPPFFHFFYSWSSQTNPVSYGSGLTNPKGQTSLHYFLPLGVAELLPWHGGSLATPNGQTPLIFIFILFFVFFLPFALEPTLLLFFNFLNIFL
jgi:hypothetical protein